MINMINISGGSSSGAIPTRANNDFDATLTDPGSRFHKLFFCTI